MNDPFADLDALVLACREPRSREMLAEAVACYRAAAFRACIVTTWVAIVFDFVHKLGEFATLGDGQAQTLWEDFEKNREAHDLGASLAFEKAVLEHCEKSFQLVSPVERLDLQRILDDRNRCAHPAMREEGERFDPPPELARLHLRNAVEILLARPPTQGKAALDALDAEVRADVFPVDWVNAKRALARGPLANARPALIRNFVLLVVKGLLAADTERALALRLSAALEASAAMHPSVFQEVIGEDAVKRLPVAACVAGQTLHVVRLLRLVPAVRAAILEGVRVHVETFMETAQEEALVSAIADSITIQDFHDLAVSRLESLNRHRLADLVVVGPRAEYAPRALALYLGSRNFDTANSIAQKLMLPLAEHVTSAMAQEIATKAVERHSQIGGSTMFPALRSRLEELKVWPADVQQNEAT